MKRLLWILYVCSVAATPIHAASFDCAKVLTKTEKLVCDSPEISALDDRLGKAYQGDLNQANREQKLRLMTEQKHWLKHTRNACDSQTCFKHAYWSRLAELETFFAPHSPLYITEANKAEPIKQVLATYPFYESNSRGPFCSKILEDLKQMKDIRFIDPIVQGQSYEDPALDTFKRQCKSKEPMHFKYECLPRIPHDYKDELADVCDANYGLAPFKLFELPPPKTSGKNRYIFYDEGVYGPMNIDNKKPSLASNGSLFHQVNFAHCDELVEHAFANASGNPNYNSIIEYKHQYYFLMLAKEYGAYWLSAVPVNGNESCQWTLKKSKPSNKK